MVQVSVLAYTVVTFMFCVATTSTKADSPASLPHDTALHSDDGGNHEVLQSHTVSIGIQTQTQTQAQTQTQTQSQTPSPSPSPTPSPTPTQISTPTPTQTQTQTQTQKIKETKHLRFRVLGSNGDKASQRGTHSDGSKASQHSTQSWLKPEKTGQGNFLEEGTEGRYHITKEESLLSGKREERRRSNLQSGYLEHDPNVSKHTQHILNTAAQETVISSLQRDFEKDGQYTWHSDSERIPGQKWFESKTSSQNEERENFSLPLDLSRCGGGHCSCFNATSGNVYAKCSDRGLQPMPKGAGPLFPAALYSFVIANQRTKQVPLERLLPYKKLRTVDASGNSLNRLSFARINHTLPLHALDLSHCGITTIDCSYFSHMPNLKRLSLKNNILPSVDSCTFQTLHYLEYLDLSINPIRTLTNGSFENLVNLQVLLLNNNHFSYLKQLTPAILQPLQQLQVLQIHCAKQPDTNHYPDKALSMLTKLRELSIDGLFGAKFGPPMKNLTQLTVLDFGSGYAGRCFTRQITSDFFANVPYLRSLNIGHCKKLESISSRAFDPLPHLEELGFSDMVYSLKGLLSELSGLRNSSIRKLTLSGVHMHRHPSLESACHFLDETDASNLRSMSNLQELDLSHNRLNVILHDFVAMLPKSLKHLNLSNNMLTSPTSVLNQGLSMSNLTVLDEANQLKIESQSWGQDVARSSRNQNQRESSTPAKHQRKCAVKRGRRARESQDAKGANVAETVSRTAVGMKCRHEGRTSHNCASSKQSAEPSRVSKSCHTESGTDNLYRAQLPPKLIVYTAFGSYNLGKVFFDPVVKQGTLKFLNLSNSNLNNWGSLYHLGPFIEIVDLSINYCEALHSHFLAPGNALREAYMQRNVLGNTFTLDRGSALRYFNNVTVINLSENIIHHLSRESMRGLVSAQYIDLSRNKLQTFEVRLAHMASLQVLDLSDNVLDWIDPDTRNDLDTIAQNHSVLLNLYPNPLKCTCSGIELLHWLATTKVHVTSKDFMFCYDENKRKQKLGDFSERVRQLQQSCTSKAYVIILSVSSVAFAFLVIGAGLLFRYRWKFIYWKNVTLTKYYGFRGGGQEGNNPRFTFDAYVLYSQEDRNFVLHECLNELETKRGHRLCVEDRDFMSGSYMPGAITSAVQNSTLTIPVITPDFIEEGDWCEYGLHMASMESLHSGRALLHPLLLRPVPHNDMPRDLLKSIQANQYSEYPPEVADEDERQAFWDALSRVLGHVGMDDGGQR